MHEDSRHIEQVLAGNREAFEPLVRKYAARVYRIVLRMIHHPEDAKDLTQEIFLLVYRKLASYNPDQRFAAWLYQIAVNRCIDEIRRRKGKRLVAVDDSWKSGDPGPEEIVMEREGVRYVMSELDRLPENQRLMFLLRFVDDLSYAEIAAVLGVSVNDVRNGLYRAKQKLRTRLDVKEGVR
jgi:RNA polymerase sigma factor (sigma-70 family)